MIPMKTLTLDGKTYEIVDEYARQALGDHAGPTDEQIREAIDTWLDENGDSIIPDISGGNVCCCTNYRSWNILSGGHFVRKC